ncbi:TadE/TadG family type IV pilus assembly protein [Microlunatus elymi]|nr:TadE/TadG family type IV pilus assembly protein [Microlunatus elymi]
MITSSRRGRSVDDERGLSTSLQFAVLAPLLMLCLLGVVQAGVWLHGRNVAAEAAHAAADVARNYHGDRSAAAEAALRVAAVGGLRDVRLRVDRSGDNVRVELSARAPLIFDIGRGRITEIATAPMERVTRP